MRHTITDQQAAYFTQNGYIELEGIPLRVDSLFDSLRRLLAARLQTEPPKLSQKTARDLYTAGRDLWRDEPALQTALIRTLAPIALALSGKNRLRLACDQWIPAGIGWEKASAAKDLFSIQGLAICLLLSPHSLSIPRKSPLGLLPLPSTPSSLLFFKPTILLDWPNLKNTAADLYLAAYTLPTSLYVENLKDPSTNSLKQWGYAFGDSLRNEFHPLIY